ncbi:MAG: carboxypeptidase-like regulatory domain-containing protein [Bacteroidales bacterium]|nr:carboxypeptidase-like regulatory domain-containing protein [Bacteroidales bacterium]MCF8336548.1 carboxypeptidase-like regulatory domain-containing protein [Bacteroidales bacterium]
MKIRAFTLAVALLVGIAAFSGNDDDSDKSSKNKNTKNRETTMVQGAVTDRSTGENLAGAEIQIRDSRQKTYTDFDGNFSFDHLQPGTYDIIVSYISYDKKLIEDIELKPGKTKNIRVKLLNAH